MPEGHTLHRLATHLQQLVVGQPWRVSSPQGRFAAGAAQLTDRTPERAQAWGKQLFIHLGADIWRIHLGLYGAFSFRGDAQFQGPRSLGAPRRAVEEFTPQYQDGWIVPETPNGAVRARIHVKHGWADLRGPARCEILNPMQYEALLGRLGPDPLQQKPGEIHDVAAATFYQNLQRRRISIAAALLDQSVIAGVGNIYRAEALFVTGINPETEAHQLSKEAAYQLWVTVTAQLRDGLAEGTITTLRPSDRPRTHRERRHWVYQHQGTPCLACGATIGMRELNSRRLYWCPGCQR